jgi:hypothetical protein
VRSLRGARGIGRWLPLAASLLIVMAIALWSGRNRLTPPGRGSSRGGDGLRVGNGALALLEPVGSLSHPPRRFRWTRDSGAASYRIELFDRDARRIGVAVTGDTTLAIEALTREPITAGQWLVVPLAADGLELPRHVRAVFEVER